MVEIRQARMEDAGNILELLGQLAKFEKMEEKFKPDHDKFRLHLSVHRNPYLGAYVAFEGDEMIGVAVFYQGEYSTFGSSWRIYLEDVFVRQDHRGKGVMRKLLAPLAKMVREFDLNEISLTVLDWNTNAIDAYDSLGATMTGHKVDEDGRKWLCMSFRGEALSILAG